MINLLSSLFLMFFKLSIFSFGGGYALIPIMLNDLEQNGLLDPSKVADVIAIAGMAPGPVAVNAAVGLGYYVSYINDMGLWGILPAFLGISIPCSAIVILVASLFFNVYHNKHVQSALYGMKVCVAAIVLYAAVKLALGNGIVLAKTSEIIQNGINIIIGGIQIIEIKSLLIFLVVFILLQKTKLHPAILIIGAAAAGILLFSF